MEKKEGKQVSFGRVLSAVRMEKGLDLNQVSDAIKVNYRVLQNLENDDHSKLPNDVYVKGFIRAYSDLLELNRSEMIKLYEESYIRYQHALKANADLVGYHSKFWMRLFTALFVMVLIIGFSVYLVPVDQDQETPVPHAEVVDVEKSVTVESKAEQAPVAVPEEIAEAVPDAVPEETVAEAPSPMPEEAVEITAESTDFDTEAPTGDDTESLEKSVEENEEALPEKEAPALSLKMKAIEETWIKIIVDKQKPRQYVLKAGDFKELKGEKGFNILIGNAGGVHVYLNDKPVDIDGKSGQVVTVQLP